MKDLIDLIGWRDIVKGLVEGLILTAYLAAVYFAICAVVPFR